MGHGADGWNYNTTGLVMGYAEEQSCADCRVDYGRGEGAGRDAVLFRGAGKGCDEEKGSGKAGGGCKGSATALEGGGDGIARWGRGEHPADGYRGGNYFVGNASFCLPTAPHLASIPPDVKENETNQRAMGEENVKAQRPGRATVESRGCIFPKGSKQSDMGRPRR